MANEGDDEFDPRFDDDPDNQAGQAEELDTDDDFNHDDDDPRIDRIEDFSH